MAPVRLVALLEWPHCSISIMPILLPSPLHLHLARNVFFFSMFEIEYRLLTTANVDGTMCVRLRSMLRWFWLLLLRAVRSIFVFCFLHLKWNFFFKTIDDVVKSLAVTIAKNFPHIIYFNFNSSLGCWCCWWIGDSEFVNIFLCNIIASFLKKMLFRLMKLQKEELLPLQVLHP